MEPAGSSTRQGRVRCLALLCCALIGLQALPPAEAQSARAPSVGPTVPAGSVVARLDRGSVALGETVSLTVIATDVDGELDTQVLEQVFDIVGRSRSSQVDVINGVRRDRNSWVLELSPRRIGVFTVPPVTVGRVTSDLQTLEVTEAPTAGERLVFLEASVDESSPWVQGQVVMTLRVFQAIEFLDAALGEPRAEGLRVQRLGEDRRARETRDGREYDVIERRYTLFPQRSGPITIDPVALDVSVPVDPERVRGFFTESRRVLRRTEPIELQVRGRPPGSTGWWLPARDVTLEAAWSGGDPALSVPAGADAATRVGVPLTRTLTLRALGAMQTQLPGIEPPTLSGASLYAEAPERVEGASDAGVLTEQRIAWAVVPEQAGTLELPATTVTWFDTVAGRERTASLPATRLHVEPAAASTVPAPAAPSGSDTGPESDVAGVLDGSDALPNSVETVASGDPAWRWLTLAVLLGWALTAFAWWRERRRGARRPVAAEAASVATGPDVRKALDVVRESERSDSPARLAAAVLGWARTRWPQQPPSSLPALAARLPDTSTATALLALDNALYASGTGEAMPPGARNLAERLDRAAGKVPVEPFAPGRGGRAREHGSGGLPEL